jgi:hypothetical protein
MELWHWLVLLDWSTFIPTTIGTLVGAGIGVWGVFLGYRLQRGKEYVAGVDDAVVQIMQAVAAYATDLHRYQTEISDRERVPQIAARDLSSVRVPNSFPLSVALDIAEVRARKQDQRIIQDALHAYRAIASSDDIEKQLRGIGMLGGALGEWRAGRRSADEVFARLIRIQDITA